MQSACVTATVDDNLLSLVSSASAEQVLPGRPSFVRHTGRMGTDSALHLATSASWNQRVVVVVEMYEPGERHGPLGPEWELDATGVLPLIDKEPLDLRSDADEPFRSPFNPDGGDYDFEAWVTGRDENRAAMQQWADWQFSPGGAAMPWEDAQHTVPECRERWIVRLTLVSSR